MKKSLWNMFFLTFLEMTDQASELSLFRTHVVLLLYFSQTLVPAFKLELPDLQNSYDELIARSFFYTNFTNLAVYFNNPLLFLAWHSFSILLIFLPLIFILYLTHTSNHRRPSLDERSFSSGLCRAFLELYDWIFINPLLETFMNPIDCDWYSFTQHCEEYTYYIFVITGTVSITWTLTQGVFLAYACQGFAFQTNRLEMNWGALGLVRMVLRSVSVIFYFELKKFSLAVYLILHAFGVLSLVEIAVAKPISNPLVRDLYVRYLFVYEAILMLLSLRSYFLVDGNAFFYCLLLLSVVAYKLGKAFKASVIRDYSLANTSILLKDLPYVQNLQEKSENEKEAFILMGFFSKYFKLAGLKPDDSKETMRERFQKDPFSFISEEKSLKFLLNLEYSEFINNKDVKQSSHKNQTILRYFDFLKRNEPNPNKLLFLFERLKPKISVNSSFLRISLWRLDTLIKERIFSDGFNHKMSSEAREQVLQLRAYFKMHKLTCEMVENIKAILTEKKTFWNDYSVGFKEMDLLVSALHSLTRKIETFKHTVRRKTKGAEFKVIGFKLLSALYSVFWNDLFLASKFEEEYQKLYSGMVLSREQGKAARLSFSDKNVAICEASFLNYEGIIREESKTARLGSVFGLEKGEVQLIKKVEELMPGYFAKHHAEFLRNYINESKKKVAKYPLKTFAKHKNGYIFSVRLYAALNSAAADDFVVITAIISDESSDEHMIVYSTEGEILGVSQKMLALLKMRLKGFDLKKFSQRSLFDFFAESKALAGITLDKNEFLLNQLGKFVWMNEDSQRKRSASSNSQLVFDVIYDLRIFKHLVSKQKEIAIFSMIVKCFEENNSHKSRFTKEIYPSVSFFEEIENIIDSFDSKLEPDKQPHHFSAKGKASLDLIGKLMTHNNTVDRHEIISNNSKTSAQLIELRKKKPVEIDKGKQIGRQTTVEVKDFQPLKTDDNDEILKRVKSKITENSITISKESRSLNQIPEVPSRQSSTIKARTKNSRVLVNIEKIKAFTPKPLVLLVASIVIEMILVFGYFLCLEINVENYLTESFLPIQNTVYRHCNQFIVYATASLVMTEYEYRALNLTVVDGADAYDRIYRQILNKTYFNAQSLVEIERRVTPTKVYETAYFNYLSNLVDITTSPFILKRVAQIDLIERNLLYLQDIYAKLGEDLTSINLDFMAYLQRTFIYFLTPASVSFLLIQDVWKEEAQALFNQFLGFFMIFFSLMVTIKLIQMAQLHMLYQIVNRLVMIFLRCNQNEAFREICFIDSLIGYYEKLGDFYEINFPERVLNRKKDVSFFTQGGQNESQKLIKPKPSKNAKETRKKAYLKKTQNKYVHMRPLKKLKGVLFLLITLMVYFAYLFGNYFYWTIYNQKVQEVIFIDSAFVSVYVYTISVVSCTNLYFRESLIKNPSYELLNETYQQPKAIEAFFIAALKKRVPYITKILNFDVEKGIIQVQETINNRAFDLLADENVCQVLLESGKIEEAEKANCEGLWGGAFLKGIMIVGSEYLKRINELTPWIIEVQANVTETKEKIKAYIRDPGHQDFFLGAKYLSDALGLFFNFVNEYYDPMIQKEKDNTIATLLVSMIFLEVGMLALIFGIRKHWNEYFRFLAMGLSIIPYEKITEDEALIQIIENFTKK